MERFLETVPEAQGRELLRLRYVEGLTVQQLQRSLAERGLFYGRRHVERLLNDAERAADALWTKWMIWYQAVFHRRMNMKGKCLKLP